MAAFEARLDALDEDPAALRAELEAALNVPSAAIQREAARRLAEWHATEGVEAPPAPRTP
jgi:hypothetical protein